ncbi:MAG: DUF1178 family protein [Acetobacter peroxydans]|jgi:hypothetical protein|nr:DUF1178 family protein [Acetobacter peroxydans]MCI2079079.1 DUF1178 family protein [Acetobacter peroxydans]
MICYRLRCAGGHQFEGWYKDSATFSRLREAGMLSCAECGMADVDQAPMAPAIVSAGRRQASASQEQAEPATATAPATRQGMHSRQNGHEPLNVSEADGVVGVMRHMRELVEAHCENVGERFAQEALRIHHGEAPERGIYGEVSARDREMLHDEGVEFHAIPWVSKTDS